jgi:hypothetical protein
LCVGPELIRCVHMYSNTPIEKKYDAYTVSPVIAAGGLPNLVILITI